MFYIVTCRIAQSVRNCKIATCSLAGNSICITATCTHRHFDHKRGGVGVVRRGDAVLLRVEELMLLVLGLVALPVATCQQTITDGKIIR